MKQVDLFLHFEKKFTWFNFFFFGLCVCVCVFLKPSMDSFLEYILDSIYVFKVVDFNVFGLHRLVWFLLRYC